MNKTTSREVFQSWVSEYMLSNLRTVIELTTRLSLFFLLNPSLDQL